MKDEAQGPAQGGEEVEEGLHAREKVVREVRLSLGGGGLADEDVEGLGAAEAGVAGEADGKEAVVGEKRGGLVGADIGEDATAVADGLIEARDEGPVADGGEKGVLVEGVVGGEDAMRLRGDACLAGAAVGGATGGGDALKHLRGDLRIAAADVAEDEIATGLGSCPVGGRGRAEGDSGAGVAEDAHGKGRGEGGQWVNVTTIMSATRTSCRSR